MGGGRKLQTEKYRYQTGCYIFNTGRLALFRNSKTVFTCLAKNEVSCHN